MTPAPLPSGHVIFSRNVPSEDTICNLLFYKELQNAARLAQFRDGVLNRCIVSTVLLESDALELPVLPDM
jgi:hypothetical protein